MNRGILNQSLLEKDIEKINFYASEETKILNEICQKFEDGTSNYNSANTSLLLSNINNFKDSIDKLTNKRENYTYILNKVILQYDNLSELSKKTFNEDI